MKNMTIKEIADLLQKRIDIRLKSFTEHDDKLKAINNEIEELEKKMVVIITELEPVESLIYNQNPQLERIFESLKRVYGKEENGIDREAH
jgi:predicted  nucleic acid-binding Zn-ribbon protein